MKHLKTLLLILIFSLIVPAFAQDATAEVTAESTAPVVVEATIVPVVPPAGDVTVINNPAETDTTPAEPAPWWAPLFVQLAIAGAAIWGVIKSLRILVEGFLSRPTQIATAEAGYGSLIPAAVKPRIRSGGKAVLADIKALADALDRAFDEVTDDESILVKNASPKLPDTGAATTSEDRERPITPQG